MEFNPYPYQRRVTEFILDTPRCAPLCDMGLGKTISTLVAIEDLIYSRFEITKVLVIAPLRVAKSTWSSEINKWNAVRHLRYSIAVGTPKQREEALYQEADIYIINRENVTWLINKFKWDFDMCVVDESSSFKSNTAKRFKSLRKVINRCSRVVLLTGTPAPKGLTDLWSQMYLLDRGERLGRTLTEFRGRYFRPGRSNGHIVYEYIPLPDSETKIYKAIDDICISMKKEDYLEMPDRIFHDVLVDLDPKTRKFYKKLEKDSIIELSQQEVILASHAGAVRNKLQQVANGAVYTQEGDVIKVHDLKIEALEDLIEAANGQPVIVFYKFKHDKSRIQEKFETYEIQEDEDIQKWNRKEMPILLAHPASIGHGLNLQQGGHIIIWFGLTDSLEEYLQANDRLYRQGQKETVQVYHIMAKNTVDDKLILPSLKNKEQGQEALLAYVKAKIKEYEKEEENV